MPPKGPIVVVGGGIAGLSLARVLKARNIPSVVLEQLPAAPRVKDRGIGLRKWAYGPLLLRIGISSSDFRAVTAVDALTGGLVVINRPLLDGRSGDTMEGAPNPSLTTEEDGYYQASRASVRSLLFKELDIRTNHLVRAFNAEEDNVKVSCEHPVHGRTLDVVEGAMVVVADSAVSDARWDMGMHHLPWYFPFLALAGRKIIPRSLYEAEIRPYMENSTVISGAVDNWRLCTFLDKKTDARVDLRVTYSRHCQDMTDFDTFHSNLKAARSVPVQSVPGDSPSMFRDEIEELGPFGPPFDVTHNLQTIDRNEPQEWLIQSRRDLKHNFATTLEGTRVPAVVIGDAALLMPCFLGEGANHAILDAVQLGDIIANSYHRDLLATVPRRFYDVAYYRWHAAIFDWESRINSFYGANNRFKPSWQPLNPKVSNRVSDLMDSPVPLPNYSSTSARNPEHLVYAEEMRCRAKSIKFRKKLEVSLDQRRKEHIKSRIKSRAGPRVARR
ncbi:hypothetical protein MMC18_001368 [Xylographa bjoerkii]|nr:hypothetical protein [Xylographa bjoerkii]